NSYWVRQHFILKQSAAHFLKEKRSAFELALSMSETASDITSSEESVVPFVYVGQFARLLEQVDGFAMQPLTDDEYTRYTIAEGKRFQDSFEIIALLKKSFESYGNLKVRRMGSLCGFQIGREYFAMDDFSNAKQFFDDVANLHRQEGWVSLLWNVLGYLRECSRKLGTVKDFIEYSLEMAALPVSASTGIQSLSFKECGPGGPASLSGRESIHKEVFGLVCGKTGLASLEDENKFKLTGDSPLHLEIDLVSPLRSVLLASVAFHEQIIRPGSSSLITVSLLSQLPLAFEIDQLEIQFNQFQCNFVIINAQRPPLDATSGDRQGFQIESAVSLALVTNKWLRLTYKITSGKYGKLECLSDIAKIRPHFTICCRAESPASMDDLPLWKYEDCVETLPTKDPALAFSGQKAIQVEEPEPQVDLALGASGPAFVGEDFMMPVTVTSNGHAVYSGELKINLVDVRGGGLFSPREAEPFSMDSHHVELVGVAGPEGEDESELGPDRIKKIQQSFGLVSVPSLTKGESWSCKLEIKWHRPKPVMLFVSLGYSPDINEVNPQKIHVHKSLQIDGKTAVVISHRFMLPFRQDPLLLSRIRPDPDSDQMPSLPLNDASVLVVSARNCSEIPLKLLSMCIDMDDNDKEESCLVHQGGEDLTGSALVPGEEFKKVFTVIPKMGLSRLTLGTVHLKWQRYSMTEDQSNFTMLNDWVSTKYKLPDVNVEVSPLVVSLDCPPYTVLGDAFTYSIKVRNQTQLLQEVRFTLADAQCFVLSGSHSDTVSVLPKSEHIQSYKLVPLASGLQQLPKVTVTTVRYSAEFQPSAAASTVFIFPSTPHFKMADREDKKMESAKAG
ncbi:LOW QUALITY PROTEIN: uncharacterized protein LOC110825300, partial [Carica papaya]|uniref:LOW QUALITY PROTEIN: uncharacterized protein LOC110825300 n=1 Tax=Carica papaya TaxID=3649 RepID=UPI000B8C85B9